jgi:hypothetical protein
MISWIVRILMVVAGVVTSWFVTKDAPIFGVAQVMVALLLLTFIVAVLAAALDNRPESFGETALTGSPRGVIGPRPEARGPTSVET